MKKYSAFFALSLNLVTTTMFCSIEIWNRTNGVAIWVNGDKECYNIGLGREHKIEPNQKNFIAEVCGGEQPNVSTVPLIKNASAYFKVYREDTKRFVLTPLKIRISPTNPDGKHFEIVPVNTLNYKP